MLLQLDGLTSIGVIHKAVFGMSTDANKHPTVGDALPDWSLPTLEGTEQRSGALRGKRVLFFIWGSW
ncbi:MAG: hypothetical protein AVDCRST_MAG93-9231 [uncultured Chloroflexia bacterium]|uniref:Alkyl hydroperoxide reductase subunit C/ Thiol specific antioxidant domain-containing protein n=1 Tax=uncultured Chloroflexia bacterium TaxID=1672391 RepID=A0A6J4N9J5_9CHLR|nr:MAG: hypothetical protein AVDCRST_MAG93-9231 [uncultured Chloroflexia bacterium]